MTDHQADLPCTEPNSSATDLYYEALLPVTLQLGNAQLEQQALDIFIEEYCVEPADPTISRGFLNGLKSLIAYTGETSDVAQAARAVSLVGLGNRTSTPAFRRKAEILYGDLLRSFATTLSNPNTSNSVESLMTAVLMGLLEVSTANS